MAEEEMSRVERPVKDKDRRSVTYYAHRGSYPTITFTNFDSLPDLFNQEYPNPISKCGFKYRDPVTGNLYNTAEEFRIIRKKANVHSQKQRN